MDSGRIHGWFWVLLGAVFALVGLLSGGYMLATYWKQGHAGEFVAKPPAFGRTGMLDKPKKMTLGDALVVPSLQVIVGWVMISVGRHLLAEDWSDE